jgi:hypothetical protein
MLTRSAAVAAACLVATGAVTALAEDQPAPATNEVAATDNPTTQTVQWAQARRFAELRRDRDAGDALPDHWRERLARTQSRRWGSNPDLARRVDPGVWLIPGNGYICLANVTPRDGSLGFGCATPSQVEQGLLQPSDLNAEGSGVVTGVMPDGVQSVTLVNLDGSRREVAVDNNVYRAAVDAQIKEVRWTDALGVVRVRSMAWETR